MKHSIDKYCQIGLQMVSIYHCRRKRVVRTSCNWISEVKEGWEESRHCPEYISLTRSIQWSLTGTVTDRELWGGGGGNRDSHWKSHNAGMAPWFPILDATHLALPFQRVSWRRPVGWGDDSSKGWLWTYVSAGWSQWFTPHQMCWQHWTGNERWVQPYNS
jgi:hypothetical protein